MDQLKKISGVDVEVITTLPNRYASFSIDAPRHEERDGVKVNRVALPSHKSGMLDQMRAFLTYYKEATNLVANKNYDLVFSTSSRLFTAFLGARISQKKNIPLYLDIRDVFVDTISDVLSPKISWLAVPFFSMIENYTFKKAQRINLVSAGFSDYFKSRYPRADYRWFTNGIDNEFLIAAPQSNLENRKKTDKPLTVLYAGNMGEGQGLHSIIPALAKRLNTKVNFRLLGDGGRKSLLESALDQISNVKILAPVSRAELINEYFDADVLFLHLNDYPAFRKVLPSKIFEYAALGKPIWAGVAGYAAEFLNKEVSNVAVFPPGDVDLAISSLGNIKMVDCERKDFVGKFSRDKIAQCMAQDIVELGKQYE
ncbi:glycosyltransferase family 4 protein [Eionea flava]